MKRLTLRAAFVMASFLTSPLVAKDSEKIAPSLLELAQSKKVSALLLFDEQADFSDMPRNLMRLERGQYVQQRLLTIATRAQPKIVSWIKRNEIEYRRYYLVNAIAVFDVTPSQLNELAGFNEVARIASNEPFQALPKRIKVDGAELAPGSNIKKIKADAVWANFDTRGEGIVVADNDTGVEWDHPALKASYRGNKGNQVEHGYHWHDAIHRPLRADVTNRCGYDLQEPCDDNDHGTHTGGTMVGEEGENKIGVAPGAKWIACRNMDAGMGQPSTYLECLEFFLAPYPQGGNSFIQGNPAMAPHVVNNSWGCPESEGCTGEEMPPALRALKAAGIMMVVAAGNEGPGCGTVKDGPAMHTDEVFVVGAYNESSNGVASFSSRGPSAATGKQAPDLIAPGVNVRSSVTGGTYASFMWSGTSMAAPHIAGVVALMWSAEPALIGKIDETATILRGATSPYKGSPACGGERSDTIPNNHAGHGLIDAVKAVEEAKAL